MRVEAKLMVCIIAVMLFSCERIKWGNVLEKDFYSAHEEIVMIPMLIPDGNGGLTSIPQWYSVNYSDRYSIHVRGEGVKGNIIKRRFWISKAIYDTIAVGSFICVEGFCDTDTAKKVSKKTTEP